MTDDQPNLFDTVRFQGIPEGGRVLNVGLNTKLPVCDFCAGEQATMYFPVEEFEVVHPQMRKNRAVVSGDRFYADDECGALFDSGKLGGLRKRYVKAQGQPPHDVAVALWMGAKEHRQGAPVRFEPGTDPEKDR